MILEAERYYEAIELACKLGTFAGAHAVYTPQPLVEEILGQIDLANKDILVLFNVEFVASLVYTYNVNPDRITFYSDSANKNRFAIKMGIKYTDIMPTDMKFDVVVGNPPYQQGKNNRFYQEFVRIAFDLSKDVVAMITPSNWTSIAATESNFLKLLKDNGLCLYKYLGDKEFDVKMLTVYFICTKLNDNQNVTLITELDSITLPRNNILYYPTTTTKSLNIITKIRGLNLPGFEGHKGGLDRNKATIDTTDKGVKCIFSAGTKSGDFDWQPVSSNHLTDNSIVGYNLHKVVVSRVTSNGKLGESKYAAPDYAIAQGTYYFKVNNPAEAQVLVSYLNSKVIKLIVHGIKGAVCSNSQNVFKYIPKINLNRTWTDAELYQYFGLTADEISYIESIVK
jgi:site-specific DNA-methyltransferase (adenine-specific)